MRNKINIISSLVVTILVISASAFSKERGVVIQKSVAKVSEGVNQNPGISVMNINNHAFWVAKDGAYTTGGSNNGVQGMGATSSSTRGVVAGGETPSAINIIDFVTIATTGDATDFGDLTAARRGFTGFSDVHGGLG